MKYKGFSLKANKAIVGDIYKQGGQFFIVTEEKDSRGFKISHEVDPRTITIEEDGKVS